MYGTGRRRKTKTLDELEFHLEKLCRSGSFMDYVLLERIRGSGSEEAEALTKSVLIEREVAPAKLGEQWEEGFVSGIRSLLGFHRLQGYDMWLRLPWGMMDGRGEVP